MGAVAAEDFAAFVHREKDGSESFDVAVRGARCAACMAKIEGGVKAIGGVNDARLNLSTGKLHVVWNRDAVKPGVVIDRVRALGYEAAPFDSAGVLDAQSQEGRHLLRCLAVAGFGMVFVVGLTDSIWYSNGDISAAHRTLFFWLAGLVAIPLTLFASEPFFASAGRALAKRQTNMDVPISAAIVLALALSVWETVSGAAQTYFDATIMLAFVLLVGRYLDYLLRDRAQGAARHLVTLQSALARRFRPDGTLETVAGRELVPGDRVLLASGERVPTDGTLEDKETEVDVSLVTGESQPVGVSAGQVLRAGTINLGRPIVVSVTAKMDDSLVADLARLLEAGRQTRSVYVRLADRAAKAYVPFVAIASLAVFAGWALVGAGFPVAMTNAIAVLIITCPCALGLAVPAVQIVATGRLFAKGVFVKSGDALERLAEIDTAVFDKTGTLTLGAPALATRVLPATLESAARLARASRHPLSRALAEAAGPGPVAAGVREVPGSGLEAEVDGIRCRLGNAEWCGVAGGHGELWFRKEGVPPLRLEFRDHIRPETRDTIAAFAPRNVAVEMLTGDHAQPAAAIAKEAGITRWRADVGPAEKAARLEDLRKHGHHTLMVGDGINDAGALALAHVSIAPGTAADVSQRASDLVLRGDSIAPIVEAIDIARKARRLVLENFAFAAVYNLAAVPVAALGLVNPLVAAGAMAGSSLIVTLNALRLARS
ncbi:MAG: cadmium-translocating P-type ATPase [Proteobacteria bacterium]|nr:cadmium-translocating P-type ATPase [Pseudomonadota bacterium]